MYKLLKFGHSWKQPLPILIALDAGSSGFKHWSSGKIICTNNLHPKKTSFSIVISLHEEKSKYVKLKYEQEIRELKKELLEIKKLSVSKLQCGSYTFTSLIGNCDKGYGEIIFNDNDKYIGEILDGQGTGIGKYVFEDGAYYVGEFIDFDFNGQGTLILSNGTQLIGYFENGSYQFGSQIDSGGITISDSNIDGISCGIIYFNGGHYKGCFKNGVWNDEKAELHAITGLAYYGAFVDGKLTDENAIIKYFDSSIKQYTGGVVDFNFEGWFPWIATILFVI